MGNWQNRHTVVARGRLGLAVGLTALVAACGGPLDAKLVTDGTQQQYRASIDAIDPELSPHERAAFNWAVAGLDLEKLNAAYPNASVREVVRTHIGSIKDGNPKEVRTLREQMQEQLPTIAELGKVRANGAKLEMEDSFFGPKPSIEARIINESSLPLSQISWEATLYINGETQPVAKAEVRSDFRKIDGLKAGDRVAARFNVGFVKGDEAWTTLSIRQAASTRVELKVIPLTAMDFSDKPYVTADYEKRIEILENQLKEADRFADI
ncbi:hypothetical protein QEG32_002097 [Stenotrophomonas maltophilia]|nr:hypothetical protein [Stenotrophomonas maltophilia]